MIVAQVSDFHVVARGDRAYGRVDTAAALDQALAALGALSPRPDLVVGTGDLVQDGTDDQYATLREILGKLQIPFAPVLGNHDRRLPFRRAFADVGVAFEPKPFIQYTLNVYGLRVIVLDTVTEGSDEPSFCKTRAAWLAQMLATSDAPTIIALHHPPFPCGVTWLEPKEADWAELLARILGDAPQVIRLISGHVHRAIHTIWHGVPASTAPSTAHQVFLDLTPQSEPRLSHEAPGFQLHRWADKQLVTYTASTLYFADNWRVAESGDAHQRSFTASDPQTIN